VTIPDPAAEFDAIVGAVADLSRIVGAPTPTVTSIHALTRAKVLAAGIPSR
jgi:ketopantoate reductase